MKNTLALVFCTLLMLSVLSETLGDEVVTFNDLEELFHDHTPKSLYIPFLTFYEHENDQGKSRWYVSFMMLVDYGDSVYASTRDTQPETFGNAIRFRRNWVLDIYSKGDDTGSKEIKGLEKIVDSLKAVRPRIRDLNRKIDSVRNSYINVETWVNNLQHTEFERILVNIGGRPYHLCSFTKEFKKNLKGQDFEDPTATTNGDEPTDYGWRVEINAHPEHSGGKDTAHQGGGLIHPNGGG